MTTSRETINLLRIDDKMYGKFCAANMLAVPTFEKAVLKHLFTKWFSRNLGIDRISYKSHTIFSGLGSQAGLQKRLSWPVTNLSKYGTNDKTGESLHRSNPN